ncbi:hypothetical protein K469DRAFT_677437 [Zopfia rhizophila CBS 207.26]|uniref:RING-type E3 ubiquitin transferase n=1 Tax=Zopfia rhizophila CBS 207.26 TaxID=1314779 RepID=A0A6A6DIM4_9PEZI|nr:hypothetical protein K469DRAFT_677437 [Zopfia rhizophila CBS 207.26]
MTRLQIYITGSAILANIVLLRAYYERPNFYSAAVYIYQSTGSLMFLINIALIVAVSLGYGFQRVLYGPLRPIETEQLYDKAWFAVSETLLAMTIFRDDIGVWFFAMFLCLLAGKVWQWIGEGRVEFLEQQPPANPRLFHTRLMSSLLLSVAFDIFMMQYCIDSILQEARPGVMVMFGFEYVLLAIASISTLLRYVLSLVELVIIRGQEKARAEARMAALEPVRQQLGVGEGATEAAAEEDDEDDGDVPGWEEKGRWVFYLDLTTDFIKSVVYLGFFVILMAFYGIPIHIMRDLFITIRSFIKKINDFVQYRHATRDMNARYPDATAEELGRENTCIVCREEMRPWADPAADAAQAGRRVDERQRPKKLPCGHILHFSCLRSWLERQQVCPTCRRPVLAEASAQNTQQTNQGNQGHQGHQGQQNQQNQPNQPNHFIFNLGNQQQQQQQGGQQGQQGGQQNRPAGNMRVFNFGPIRIALGNFRAPANQQGNANNDINAAMERLRQHFPPGFGNPNQDQNPPQNQAPPQLIDLHLPEAPTTGISAGTPADIQSDILRLQQNIINSIRQLHATHSQLEYIHVLLGELNRLQRAAGITAASGQELPTIAPLNPNYGPSGLAQAYFPNGGQVLRQGDEGLPAGLTLPEGWTLRRLAQVPQGGSQEAQIPASLHRAAQSISETLEGFGLHDTVLSSSTSTEQPQTTSPPPLPQPSSSEQRAPPSPPAGPSSKQAEPSSLESSWSFGNVAAPGEGEGSSSAVASGSSEGNVTRRTATVEDAEDDEQ